MSQQKDQETDPELTPRASINCLQTSEPVNMDRSQEPTEQVKDPDLKPPAQLLTPANIHCLHNSESLKMAIHGMGNLINSRLSKPAMDICIELLEAGVNPKALAHVVLHTMEVKESTNDDSLPDVSK